MNNSYASVDTVWQLTSIAASKYTPMFELTHKIINLSFTKLNDTNFNEFTRDQ